MWQIPSFKIDCAKVRRQEKQLQREAASGNTSYFTPNGEHKALSEVIIKLFWQIIIM